MSALCFGFDFGVAFGFAFGVILVVAFGVGGSLVIFCLLWGVFQQALSVHGLLPGYQQN